MKFRKYIVLCLAAMTLVAASQAFAQMHRAETVDEPVWLDSGRFDNSTDEEIIVDLGSIEATSGHWMRVHVADFHLGAASYLSLTALDGHVQSLDARSLQDWHYWSAMLNGKVLEIALHIAPGDVGVFVQIDQVRTPLQEALLEQEGEVAAICNNFDDRVASSDLRVGRLSGCTGWLVSSGVVITAGHCLSIGPTTVMEFNVPPSLPNGITVSASPANQFPVNLSRMQSENGGVGEDWMVLGLNPNASGVKAHEVNGYFRMTSLGPSIDTTMRVTGYGNDNTPPSAGGSFCLGGPNQGNPCMTDANCPPGNPGQCTGPACCDPDSTGPDPCQNNCNAASSTQQTATGRLDDLDGDVIEFDVDTRPGSSGGPIIWDASTGFTIGVNTHAGCDSFIDGYNNHGTRLHRGVFEAALQNYWGPGTLFVDWADAGLPTTGRIYEPLHTMSLAVAAVPDGGIIAMVGGDYPKAAGNTFVAGADGKAMTFIAPVGPAVIGN